MPSNARVTVTEMKRPASSGMGTIADTALLKKAIYHDLRHPLATILAYSELLTEVNLDQPQREDFYQEIRLAVRRMDDLLSSLLAPSRQVVNVRAEIGDIVATIKHAIHAVVVKPEFRRVSICFDHQGLSQGWFDRGRLERVITNVVLNACEAVSRSTGRIEVRSWGKDDRFEISVADNGPGIPRSIRGAVFLPYVTYGKESGTGLGLAVAQEILRDHGGDIYLRRTGKSGTEFRLILPSVHAPDSHQQGL